MTPNKPEGGVFNTQDRDFDMEYDFNVNSDD